MNTDDIKAELRALADDINALVKVEDGDYSTAFFAVIVEHPDLAARWDRLREETFLIRELR